MAQENFNKNGNCVQSDLKPSCEVTPIYTSRKEELDMKPWIFILGQLEWS
jgi:hypothetical protein